MARTATSNVDRWNGHPVLASLTRAATIVVPFVVAMIVAFILSSQLPRFDSLPATVARWVTIVAVATLAMRVTDSLARRLLPLTALLQLTLLFPDRAPSRCKLAMMGP